MGKIWQRMSLALMLVILTTVTAWADVSDTGTEDDPYVVTTWGDLKTKMAAGGYIRLDANVSDPDKTSSSYLNVPQGITVTIDLNGHTIDRALTAATSDGYVINVVGTLTINDSQGGGTITGGNAADDGKAKGGALYVGNNATFTMNGGTISGNTADNGGGVYVEEGGTFTMNGGTISSNAALWAGGVDVRGTFTMSGGEISSNTASRVGGGVSVALSGAFTMSDGKISNNTATNYGGGVFVEYSNSFTFSGSAFVSGNKRSNGSADNVYIYWTTITVSNLTADASIGVTTATEPTASDYVTFATEVSAADAAHFFGDDPAFAVEFVNGEPNGELRLIKRTTAWDLLQAQLDEGGTVTLTNDVTATAHDVMLTVTNTVTLDLNGHTLDADGRFGVIEIRSGGDLTLNNSVPESGAITGGNAADGGGVYVADGGAFTMNGGTITGNTASDVGGGVCVEAYGTFTMTGGTISGNSAVWASGVEAYGTFTMTGGTITGNTACVVDGGGVYVDGTFTVSGSPVIYGNTDSEGAASNVYLPSGCSIAVDGLSANASIGVTTEVAPTLSNPVTFTTGAAVGDEARFFGDDPAFAVDAANGELCLRLVKITLPTGITASGTNVFNQTDGTYAVPGTNVTLVAQAGYIVSDVSSSNVSITENNGVYTFEMPASDVTVTATVSIPYILADGTTAYCADFTVIDENYDFGSGTTATIGVNNNTEQWFVVKGTVTVDKPVIVNGNSRIILCDGATLNITVDDSYNAAFSGASSKNLTIYGQSAGTGTLNVQNANGVAIAARVSSITINGGTIIANSDCNIGFDIFEATAIINGGTITATGTGSGIITSGFCLDEGGSLTVNGGAVSATGGDYGIHFEDGSLTINGGTLSATGNTYGINTKQGTLAINNGAVSATGINKGLYIGQGYLILGWTSGNDCITFTANSYGIDNYNAKVKIADGKTLYNGTETLSGTLYVYDGDFPMDPSTVFSKLLGKTLQPYIEWEGTGTEDDPWVIDYSCQLDLLARRVNSGTNGETANTYEGKYFKLGADITFDYDASEGDDYAENYEAIGYCYGTTYHPFGGNFNGDGHTISGIRLRKEGTDEADRYQGLFGVIGSGANIHHVHVTAARIKGLNHVGGIVGWNAGGTVSNCTVTESVITATNNDYYGTICGVSQSTNLSHNYYYGCTVNGTASATNVGCNGADVTTNDGAVHVNGTCGDTGVNGGADVTWSYDTNTKALTISGTGQIMYYGSALGSDSQYHSTAPWSAYDSEIKTVVVNNGVTYIGSYAFAYCSALTSISLPASVVALGDYVCYGSSNGSTNLRIDIPSVVAVTIGAGGFDATPANLKIAVPAELLDDYQVATNWSGYAAKMVGVLSETTGFGTTFATGKYEYKRTFNCGVAATICLPFELSSTQISPYGKVYTFDGVDKTTEPKWTVVMREEDPSNRVTGNLSANTPYLFLPYILNGKSKGDAMPLIFTGAVTTAANAGYASWSEGTAGAYWTFQGVYYNVAWNDGDANLGKVYGFAALSYDGGSYNVSPGDFVKAAAGASIAPFRAFLQFTPSSSAQRRGAADNEALPSSMSVRLVDSDGIVTAVGTIDTRTGEVSFDSEAWYTLDGRRLNSAPSTSGIYIKNGKKILVK